MAFEFFYDLALIVLRNCILLPMTVLEAALLRFEWLQLCYSKSSETGHGRGGQLVFAVSVMERLLHMVPTNEGEVHAHEIDVCNVVHQKEELCLSTWRRA